MIDQSTLCASTYVNRGRFETPRRSSPRHLSHPSGWIHIPLHHSRNLGRAFPAEFWKWWQAIVVSTTGHNRTCDRWSSNQQPDSRTIGKTVQNIHFNLRSAQSLLSNSEEYNDISRIPPRWPRTGGATVWRSGKCWHLRDLLIKIMAKVFRN